MQDHRNTFMTLQSTTHENNPCTAQSRSSHGGIKFQNRKSSKGAVALVEQQSSVGKRVAGGYKSSSAFGSSNRSHNKWQKDPIQSCQQQQSYIDQPEQQQSERQTITSNQQFPTGNTSSDHYYKQYNNFQGIEVQCDNVGPPREKERGGNYLAKNHAGIRNGSSNCQTAGDSIIHIDGEEQAAHFIDEDGNGVGNDQQSTSFQQHHQNSHHYNFLQYQTEANQQHTNDLLEVNEDLNYDKNVVQGYHTFNQKGQLIQKQQDEEVGSQNQQYPFLEMSTRGSQHQHSLISQLEQQYDKSVHARQIMNDNYNAMQHQDLNFYQNYNFNGNNSSSANDSMLITNQECGEVSVNQMHAPVNQMASAHTIGLGLGNPGDTQCFQEQLDYSREDVEAQDMGDMDHKERHNLGQLDFPDSIQHETYDSTNGHQYHPFENTAYPQINPMAQGANHSTVSQRNGQGGLPQHQGSSFNRSNSATECISKARKSVTSRHRQGMSPSSPSLLSSHFNNQGRHNPGAAGFQQHYSTVRSSASFDPMKRSIVQNHMSHKGRVTNLQQEFAEQKQMMKKHLGERVQALRTCVIQTQKKLKLAINEREIAADTVEQLRHSFKQKQQKVIDTKKQTAQLKSEMSELVKDVQEIEGFKQSLQHELKQEIKFKSEIQRIAIKYKKLIQEQRKDKEKIAQGLVQQRKIIANLQSRRNQLMDDNNKIYDDFNKVVAQDRLRQTEISKICQIKLSRLDQNVLNC